MSDPNYRQLSPPEDKPPEEYTYSERRAELHDMIERAGHYRNLERSQRELGRRYDVSHTTIQNDIEAINEWVAANLGENAETELEMLKNAAIQEYLDKDQTGKAVYLLMNYYETLLEAGIKDKGEEKHHHSFESPEDAYFAMLTEANADDHPED